MNEPNEGESNKGADANEFGVDSDDVSKYTKFLLEGSLGVLDLQSVFVVNE